MVIEQLSIVRWLHISNIDFWAKMVSFWEALLGKMFVCCTLTIVYILYNTVGRFIASIYNLSGIFTSGRIYIRYGFPTVLYTVYTLHIYSDITTTMKYG